LLVILNAGIHIVLSDVDCVWSADPDAFVRGNVPGYEDFAHADVISATDCMDVEDDYHQSGCMNGLIDKNTGVLAIRATREGIAAMAEWRIRLAVAQKDEQDQTTFMDLIDGNGRGHRWGMSRGEKQDWSRFAKQYCGLARKGYLRGFAEPAEIHSALSRRIFDVCLPNITRFRLGIFPITEVAGGHTFFIQQLQTPTARWPMAVHATYQFGDQTDYPFGKRQRFRDWGMWLVDRDDELVHGSRYLVLQDDEPLAPVKDWIGMRKTPVGASVEEDLLVRGRQHVSHLERLRQRLALGVALARALNRTVVLPTLWCYCDKFWHRLDACAIPSARSSQPLPFVCPMDHVVDPALWHGNMNRRMARRRNGMLADRADGPWEDGIPFRGRYWLRQLGEHPKVGLSAATLTARPTEEPRFPLPRELLAATRSNLPGGQPIAAAADLLRHEFVASEDGPRLVLPSGQSDVALRQALQPYAHVQLLRVSLTDAGALLGCIQGRQEAQDVSRLLTMLFKAEWCYRPQEMTDKWLAVDRGPKPRKGTEPWCVWGYADPAAPAVCPA